MLVNSIFDFASAGPGTFTFAPVLSFQKLVQRSDSPKRPASLDHLSISSTSVDAHISGDLAKRDLRVLDARAVDICT